jgi:hypothetical protein
MRQNVASLWLALAIGISGVAIAQAGAPSAPAAAPDGGSLIIENNPLPPAHPHGNYSFLFKAHGGVPQLHWRAVSDLPGGLRLEDDGTLHGAPEKTGEYRFSVSVTDGGQPKQAVQREFTLNVTASLIMEWKIPAHVTGGRIEGSVQVSNGTNDDFDFTFVVLAVAENGRATAIGYQRFDLKKGTTDFEIPFGENLPHGGYVVHVDGVGEVAALNQINRARLQTPGPLQVAVGP